MMTDAALQSFLLDRIKTYRAETFCSLPHLRVTTLEGAVEFVNRRGFVFFWPIKDVILPSLWIANAGDRPVPDEHDDPGHVTWNWKDSMLGQRRWYYGRILHKRNTIISLESASYFYALTENYGDFHEDYLIQYEQGQMTLEARLVYEALLKGGPLDTITLRKSAHLTGPNSDGPFNKALNDLMVDFKVIPVGVSDAGTWHYAHVYDIVARHLPDLVEKARFIQEPSARKKLAGQYFASVGAARLVDLARLFGWAPVDAAKAGQQLEQDGMIQGGFSLPSASGNWFILNQLLS
jgi:hypothetical protein